MTRVDSIIPATELIANLWKSEDCMRQGVSWLCLLGELVSWLLLSCVERRVLHTSVD